MKIDHFSRWLTKHSPAFLEADVFTAVLDEEGEPVWIDGCQQFELTEQTAGFVMKLKDNLPDGFYPKGGGWAVVVLSDSNPNTVGFVRMGGIMYYITGFASATGQGHHLSLIGKVADPEDLLAHGIA